LSLPAYAFFVACLGAIVAVIYTVETLVGEVYDGPLNAQLRTARSLEAQRRQRPPSEGASSLRSRLISFAAKLTAFENHPRQSDYDASLALKTFALNFVSAYGLSAGSVIEAPCLHMHNYAQRVHLRHNGDKDHRRKERLVCDPG
jgi:anoctamin-10